MTAEFLDLGRLWHLLLSRLWVIAACLLLAGLAAAAYLWRAPRIYAARVVVQVEQEPRKVITFEDVNQDDLKPTEALKTLEQVLTNRSLLRRVVESNQLADNPAFWRGPNGQPALAPAMTDLVDLLASRLGVSLRRGTRLIDIAVEDRDPELARKLADSLIQEFVFKDIDDHADVSKLAYQLLSRQAEELKVKLEKSDADLQAYREKTHAVSLEDSQNIIVGKLRELSTKVTEAKGKRLDLESAVALIGAAKAPGTAEPDPEKLLRIPAITATPEVVDLRKELNAREAELAVIEKRYLYKHPKNVWAKNQIAQLRSALNRAAVKSAAVLASSHQSARETEAALEGALAQQEGAALELNRIAGPFNVLLRQRQNDQALYDSLLTRLKQTDVLSVVLPGMGKSNLRVIEPATASTRPVKPHRLKTLALALAAGLGLGVAAALGLEIFDGSLRNVDQAEEALDLPALATVPETRRARRRPAGRPAGVTAADEHNLPLVHAPDSPAAEAFRSLRTMLPLAARDLDRDGRSVLFTSAVPGEGKTYCSVNYAVSLAQQGLTTLFINADLRRPRANEMLGSRQNSLGLANCLGDNLALGRAVHPTSIDKLFICPSGRRVSNPSELLTGNRFGVLLAEALQVFERVVVDSPPVQAVSDPLLLVKHVDAVCLVVRAEKTPRRVVQRACHMLARAKTEPAGFVFNRISTGLAARYGYYYYGSEYADAQPAAETR